MEKLTMNECSKRKLDEMYIVVYAIKNEVNIKKADYIEKSIIYTFVGIDSKGYRQLLNVYQDRTSNNRYWLDCFEALKSRGLKRILFLSVDDNKNMKRTAKIAFPDITFVDSPTELMTKFYKYTSERSGRQVGGKLFGLYTQKTISDFKTAFEAFKHTYNNVIHQKLINKYLSNVEKLYKYSENIRHLLFKHSANVYLYDRIRLYFNTQSCYIEKIDEIFDKLGSLQDYFGFTSFKKKEWTFILNDLIQMYPEIDFI
ncbi:MAG: transposase [Clostridia bacterium]|nr:transposase [Bacilli bacterium]MBR3255863.1 transposase [Clostridia bacterium]